MYRWARHHPGGYECSSRGDRRYSAFNAQMPDGRTIEEHYQCDIKGYNSGGTNWRLGKGKPPLRTIEDLYPSYLILWTVWACANPYRLEELRQLAQNHGKVLTDCFASGPVNQARALADLLNTVYPRD